MKPRRLPGSPLPFVPSLLLCGLLALSGLLTLSGCADDHDVNTPTTAIMNGGDWRDEVIYQIIIDRFSDGDPNNDHRVDYSAPGRYQGGDWQGVIDHLDYLQTLGVTALWISPIVKNIDYDAGFDAYHGYWTQSLNKINPHFGSPAKLREMVDQAHGRGMKVILDLVTNHMGQLFYYDINGNGQPDQNLSGSTAKDTQGDGKTPTDDLAILHRYDEYDPDFQPTRVQGFTQEGSYGEAPIHFLDIPEINRVVPDPVHYGPGDGDVLDFSRPGVYNRNGRTTNYDNWDQLTTADFPGGLKDLDTRRDDVRRGFIHAFARYVREFDFDGFRIDTLKHVEHEFWQVFTNGIRKYVHGDPTSKVYGIDPLTVPKKNWLMFGEAFDGDDSLLGSYTYNNEVDSVFYFSQKFQVYGDVVKCSGKTTEAESLWNDRLLFQPDKAQKHAANYNTGRFHSTGGVQKDGSPVGVPVPDPAVGKPIYNQDPIPGGPVAPDGSGIPPSRLLVNFLDNHDVSRFLSEINACNNDPYNRDVALGQLHNALALMLTQDGIPCIYYGTEQEFHGGNDPANRERLFDTILRNAYLGSSSAQREMLAHSAFDTTNDTFRWIQKLIKMRKSYVPLRRGDLRVTWSTDRTAGEEDAGILAFTRSHDNKSVLVVTNVSAVDAGNPAKSSQTSYKGSQMQTPFSAGTHLVDILQDPLDHQDKSYVVGAGGVVTIRVSPRATQVLVPDTDLAKTPG